MGVSRPHDKKNGKQGGGEEAETPGPGTPGPGTPGQSWEELVALVTPIAKPLATKKLAKRLYKCIKKAHSKKQVRKGVREVQKNVRKGETGIVVFAGDTTPIDVSSHMPIVCEDKNIAYCYTPSKQDLGAACGSKRPTCMVLIKRDDDYTDIYDQCLQDVKDLPAPV